MEGQVMIKLKDLVMIVALAVALGLGTACFGLFEDSKKTPKEAQIPECAGLSGKARIDCEAQHKKQ
jgi:hypothetical protein